MLRPRIIPSLLIRNGGLVKTRKFGDEKYVGDPINAVKIFNEKRVDELMICDIDATVNKRAPDMKLLRNIAVESRMPLCYGGGVTSAREAVEIISLGFEKVSVSAAAIQRPQLIREMADSIGSQSVVVTFDVKKTGFFGDVAIHTHNGTKKHTKKLMEALVEAESLGAGEIVLNSIERDGTMGGYDIDLARRVREAVTIPLTMLGGAGSTDHMRQLIDAIGVCGAAAGSMFVFKGIYRAVLITYARP
ncbi:imidazole glycerol phosphate synthase subunit HisF [Pigmentiphaga sp. NML080357]|nr:imidazole glycerol phosphate synthase subunit HisF [Pigmentiphaga sp. NML080357]